MFQRATKKPWGNTTPASFGRYGIIISNMTLEKQPEENLLKQEGGNVEGKRDEVLDLDDLLDEVEKKFNLENSEKKDLDK